MLRKGLLLAAVLAPAGLAPAAPVPPPASAIPPAAPARIHGPGEQLERAVSEVIVSLLRDNGPAAVAGMDRIDAACRKLSRDDVPGIPRDVVVYDQALHTALARSRELARGNHVTNAFDQFVWVMRSCRNCHELARRTGLDPRRPFGDAVPGASRQP